MSQPATPHEAVRELSRLRAQLEEIDRQVFDLVVLRTKLAAEAGRAKRVAGLPLRDPVREARVMETIAAEARQAGMPESEVRQIFRLLITIARTWQEAAP